MVRSLSSFLRATSGAAATEMVLILPLALVLIFTTFEGAYFMWSEHKVVKGVRDAARYAGRLDFSNYNCGSNTFTGDATALKNLTRTGQLTGGNATVPGWVNNDVTITVSCASGTGGLYDSVGNNAPRITISTRFAYQPLLGSLGYAGFAGRQFFLGASAQSPVMGL